ncbi:MAG: hypothetical protein IIU77_05665 [Clostridia bacterium]|nr:hypothetical protein [Clostridia bacterium]MBQ5602291.1 hypothetical protein [Clostridia bacterium]
MLQFLFNIFNSLISAITHPSFWIILVLAIAGLFLLFIAIKSMRLIFQIIERQSFCGKLKKWAKKNGYAYKKINNPIKSLFNSYAGEDITLHSQNKFYSIKFIPYLLSGQSFHIENENEGSINEHLIYFTNFNRHNTTFDSDSLGRKVRLDLTFTNYNSQNIFIIPRKAYNVSFTDETSKIPADCGVSYKDKFIFYRSDLLISYLEREEDK